MTPRDHRFYVFRGTLPGDAPSYVTRQADADLLEGLRDGSFCCVLSSRQMGKSSLMVRTALRLKAEGAAVAIVDLTSIGRNLTVAQWYLGVLSNIGQWLDLEAEIEEFWHAHEALSPLQRWMGALRDVVLAKSERDVILFIDEIDFVRTLDFSTDEFFAAIRECYNRRTQDPRFNRLTFCLLGVASPSDLIRDTRATPFNIARRIQVTDFTPGEAAPLLEGLGPRTTADSTSRKPKRPAGDAETPGQEARPPESMSEGHSAAGQLAKEFTPSPPIDNRRLLDRALYWTGGHPYLTQRLCHRLAEDADRTAESVDRACEDLFLSPSVREQEDNLIFARDRLLRSDQNLADVLTLYGQVRAGRRVRCDETNPLVNVLQLSGIVRVEAGYLKVRNRIYERVFDRAWVLANMPDAELRRQRAAYRRGIAVAALGAAGIVALLGALAFAAVKFAKLAAANERQARNNLYSADMVLGMQAWTTGNLGFARDLLDRHKGEDVRGFEWHLLASLCRGDDVWRSERFLQAVNSVAISPDGGLLAGAVDDGTVALWKLHSHKSTRVPIWHRNGANVAAFDPTGRILAIGWGDGTISLWSIDRRAEVVLRDARVTPNDVRRVEFSRDGRRLAAASYNGTLTLWNASAHTLIWTMNEEYENLQSLAISPDGKTLAVGSYDTVYWIDAATPRKRPLAQFPAELGFIQSVRFSPGGKSLAASGFGRKVYLWNLADRSVEILPTTHLGSISCLAFAPEGDSLATASSDGTIRVWGLHGRQKFLEIHTFRGHTDAVTSVTFHPARRTLLASGSGDGTVRLWDIAMSGDPRILAAHAGPVLSVAFSPDHRRLATGSNNGVITLWDLFHLENKPVRFRAHSQKVYRLAFSPEGSVLASASADTTVKLWRIDQDPVRPIATWQAEEKTRNRMLFVAYSADGKWLAATGWDKSVHVWRVPGRRRLARIFDHEEVYKCPRDAADGQDSFQGNVLAISPDSGTLAVNSKKPRIVLWNLALGPKQQPLSIPAREGTVDALGFSPDGKSLAFGSDDKSVVVVDLKTRQATSRIGHTSSVWAMAFSPDGRTLATGSPDLTVKLWNMRLNNEVATLNGHTNAVMAVAFSPDGKLLASADYDGNVLLWRSN